MTRLSGARVLLTGASGLIGSQVLPLLKDADVVAVSRFPRRNEDGVEWLTRDLAEPKSAFEVVTSVRPDVVIHLAGAVVGDRSLEAVTPTLGANLVATVELLEAATTVGCERIVLSGSLLEEPGSGGVSAVPPSPYGASRWAACAYGRMFHTLFEAPVVILRPSFAYGPGQEPTKLIPYVIGTLLDGGSPRLSSGQRRLDCVYSEDVARAYMDAATVPGVEGRTIDLGCGTVSSVRSIVERIVGLLGPTLGRPVFDALPVRPLEQEVEVDVEEAAEALGWRATTSLEDGLRRTIEWFREGRVPQTGRIFSH
jgi:nucleoside-diphosphate-sugar epimerase